MRPTLAHTEALKRLEQLQSALEAHYALTTGWSVATFVFTDAARAAELATLDATTGIGAHQALPQECLLIHQTADALEVSLFFDAALLGRIAAASEVASAQQIDDFLLAVEGVSHCVHLGWHAERERQTTALCMELQAEVDKFLLLADAQGYGASCHPGDSASVRRRQLHALHERLFEHVQFARDMSADWCLRYRRANALAARYCWHLIDAGLGQQGGQAVVDELHRFFRLSQSEKVRHIEGGYRLSS